MAFRFHEFRPVCPTPTKVMDTVLSHSIVDGVDIVTPIQVDAAELAAKLPSPDDYKLSNLIKAGVDVHTVDPVIFNDTEADAENFVKTNLSLDDVPLQPDDNPVINN